MQISLEQISLDKAEGLERNLNVTIPAENINSKVSEKLKEYSKQVRIPGFRPGKVPQNILSQRYGKGARQEVLSDLINSTIQNAVKENDLSIAETPEITEVKDLDDGGYSFVAKLELMPEIPKIDFASIVVKTEKSEVTEADVDKMIKKLQKQKQDWKSSKAKIGNGDLVTIEYTAKEGKQAVHPDSGTEKMGILLGESGVPQELVDSIIGMKSGESASLKVSFPDVFNVSAMAGKELTVEFEIIDHKKGKLPKVDEEFVKLFGIASGKEDDLKSEINDNLNRELNNAIQAKTKNAVLKALNEEVKNVIISEKMISRESAALAHQSMDQAKQMGIENPPHPDHKDFEELARERIINSLIVRKIAQSETIQIDYTKVREKVIEVSQTFENPPEIVEHYYKTPELLASIENTVLETQVIDWIASKVDLKQKKVAFDKLMKEAS
ncbi:MAG: trigger factor [Proteobacteria bacterium]|nr:trigger factor [Pseudomonadota bacterium]